VSGGATARAHASGEASAELCRPRGTSNRKRRAFGYQHSEYSRDGSGRRVWKHWEIDKDLDRYVERVVDLETGDVLIDKVERLTDHRGFGSARFGAEGGPDE